MQQLRHPSRIHGRDSPDRPLGLKKSASLFPRLPRARWREQATGDYLPAGGSNGRSCTTPAAPLGSSRTDLR